MSKRTRAVGPRLDPRQLNLLNNLEKSLIRVPDEPSEAPASHDLDQRVRRWLNEAIAQTDLTRDQIADAMTSLSGRTVTSTMINSWTGSSRPNQMPLHLITAFCVAVGNSHVMTKVSEHMGMRLCDTVEAQLAKLGQWSLVIGMAQEQQRLIAQSLPPLPLMRGR